MFNLIIGIIVLVASFIGYIFGDVQDATFTLVLAAMNLFIGYEAIKNKEAK
ncbi:hypothetical protein NGI46_08065 [Peribacillus butanolivorans]|uniref:hypothetical protein n=1 Tax=Peribacillus butanolivorans TaxID=421767 RepID=UPI00207CFD48|nr:hypothetical protein [Peribacillus butanolivorans]MCO0597422.1 hypothetical protein [Peribacillus butanolivorans]